MLDTSNAGKSLSSIELRLFNEIALFSASGFVVSMIFIVVGGLRVLYPWF